MRASSSIAVQCADWIATQQCFLPGLKRGKVLICGKGTFCARSIILRAQWEK